MENKLIIVCVIFLNHRKTFLHKKCIHVICHYDQLCLYIFLMAIHYSLSGCSGGCSGNFSIYLPNIKLSWRDTDFWS